MFRFMYYQCKESDIPMPDWSRVWINVRKSYCNFYQLPRGGIETMLKNLGNFVQYLQVVLMLCVRYLYNS